MRTCAKSRCDADAVATVALRYQPREVLISDLRPEADRRLLDFCSAHAASLVAPVGWILRDVRSSQRPQQAFPLRAPYASAG